MLLVGGLETNYKNMDIYALDKKLQAWQQEQENMQQVQKNVAVASEQIMEQKKRISELEQSLHKSKLNEMHIDAEMQKQLRCNRELDKYIDQE